MKKQSRTWLLIARVLILALAIAAAPMPSLAGDTSQTPPAPVLKNAIAKAVASTPLSSARAQGTAAKADKSELGSVGFFKKPAGIIAIVAVIAGTGLMVNSFFNKDRIKSVVRQGQ